MFGLPVARRLRASRGGRPGLVLVELSVVEQRYRVVLAVEAGATVSEIARQVGVSRQTVHSWLARYANHGLAGLADRSKRPRSCPHQLPVSVRAGHTSVAFTLDRYGHLFPGHDDELRDRLDAMHAQGLQAVPGGRVLELPGGPARPAAAPARPTANQANNKARRRTGPGLG